MLHSILWFTLYILWCTLYILRFTLYIFIKLVILVLLRLATLMCRSHNIMKQLGLVHVVANDVYPIDTVDRRPTPDYL